MVAERYVAFYEVFSLTYSIKSRQSIGLRTQTIVKTFGKHTNTTYILHCCKYLEFLRLILFRMRPVEIQVVRLYNLKFDLEHISNCCTNNLSQVSLPRAKKQKVCSLRSYVSVRCLHIVTLQ